MTTELFRRLEALKPKRRVSEGGGFSSVGLGEGFRFLRGLITPPSPEEQERQQQAVLQAGPLEQIGRAALTYPFFAGLGRGGFISKTLEEGFVAARAGQAARAAPAVAKSAVLTAARGPAAQAVVPVKQATTLARKRIPTGRPISRNIEELADSIDQLTAEVETLGEVGVRPLRPPEGVATWTKGLTNQELTAIAKHENVNPLKTDWWDSLDSVVIKEAKEGRFKNLGAESLVAKKARLAQMNRELDQLLAVAPETPSVAKAPSTAVPARGRVTEAVAPKPGAAPEVTQPVQPSAAGQGLPPPAAAAPTRAGPLVDRQAAPRAAGGRSGRPRLPPTARGGPELPPPPPQDPNQLIQALAKAIRQAKRPLGVKEAEVTKELGKRAAQAQRALQAGDRIRARAAFIGELPQAGDVLPISREFTAADGATLRQMIVKKYSTGNLGDSFEFMQADTAFTKLWDKGQTPTRSELVVLEDVFGKPFVESVLSLRSMPTKAWELFLELWNAPRAMLATGDISASLRQAAPFVFSDKGKPWLDAFRSQLKAFRSEANALASAKRIQEHPLHASSQRAGLDLTVPATVRRAAPITAREEPFIGARLLAKIPIYGKIVRGSERAYVTMLNEVRFDTFVREATKLGAGATTKELKDIANTINVLSGRASLGKFTEASAILNGIFFAPRFALSRFTAPAQVVVGSAASRKLAARLLVSYASTVTGMLALADISGVAEVEWNPLSSDFGKFRFGKLRVDPWAGLQQPIVLVSRIAAGKTKRLATGQVQKLDAGRAIQQFLESKLQPSPRTLLKRGEGFAGKKMLGTSPIPGVPNIIFDNFVFIFAQDILEAVQEMGPKGLAVAPLSMLGVGVQTFKTGLWADDFADYFSIPAKADEREAMSIDMTRSSYLKENPDVNAKLFLVDEITTLHSDEAVQQAAQLIQEQRIDVNEIRAIKERLEAARERQNLGLAPKLDETRVADLMELIGVLPSAERLSLMERASQLLNRSGRVSQERSSGQPVPFQTTQVPSRRSAGSWEPVGATP